MFIDAEIGISVPLIKQEDALDWIMFIDAGNVICAQNTKYEVDSDHGRFIDVGNWNRCSEFKILSYFKSKMFFGPRNGIVINSNQQNALYDIMFIVTRNLFGVTKSKHGCVLGILIFISLINEIGGPNLNLGGAVYHVMVFATRNGIGLSNDNLGGILHYVRL